MATYFKLLLAASLLPAVYAPRCHAEGVADIVNEVNQDSYSNYLNSLYTHNGDNRGARMPGAQHGPARDYIAATLTGFGLSTTVDEFTFTRPPEKPAPGTYSGANVVAELRGTQYPDEYIILGAHYDSAGNPGADDDATGVAALLETARILSTRKFAYSIRFIAFDFEEFFCSGAASWIARHPNDRVRGMVEMDMIGYNHQGENRAEVYNFGDVPNNVQRSLLDAIGRYGNGLTAAYMGPEPASDHGPFGNAGIDNALLTEGAPYSPDFHKVSDALESGNIDLPYAVNMTRSALGWLAEQAQPAEPAPEAPPVN